MIYMLIPVGIVWFIYVRWADDKTTVAYALTRMILQLLLIGYLLVYIFRSDSSLMVISMLTLMLVVASLIATRTIKKRTIKEYLYALCAIFVSVFVNLSLISQGVLKIEPWYNPIYIIPLSGMIFSVSMNALSLASERFESEKSLGKDYKEARNISFKTALIPIINSLFAVGLVSLPGLMTGQILSGVDPLVAVRYQIVIMLMLFGAAGISTAIYLKFLE